METFETFLILVIILIILYEIIKLEILVNKRWLMDLSWRPDCPFVHSPDFPFVHSMSQTPSSLNLKQKTPQDILITAVFANLQSIDMPPTQRFLERAWNLQTNKGISQSERFVNLLSSLSQQIDSQRYPHIHELLKQSKPSIPFQFATDSTVNFLSQQRKMWVKNLAELDDEDLNKISLNILNVPNGFSSLISLVQIEKKLQEIQAMPNQSLDDTYDRLTLDRISANQLTEKMKQLGEMIFLLADLRDFDRVYDLVQSSGNIKGALLSVLFNFFVEKDQLDQALEIARSIPMPGQKVALLLQMAELFKQVPSRAAQSEEILQEASNYLVNLTPDERLLTDPLLNDLLKTSIY